MMWDIIILSILGTYWNNDISLIQHRCHLSVLHDFVRGFTKLLNTHFVVMVLFLRSANNSMCNVFSKCFVIIYKAFQITMGIPFGFITFKSIKIKYIENKLALIQSIFISALSFQYLYRFPQSRNQIDFTWYCVFKIQYITYVLILCCGVKDDISLCHLTRYLRTIDTKMISHASYIFEVKLMLTIFACLLYRIISTVVYCIYIDWCFESNWFTGLYQLIFLSLDIIIATYAFMFYAVSCRLETLNSVLKERNTDILSMQFLYKKLVDIIEKYKATFDPLMLAALLFNIPEVMMTIFLTVLDIRNSKGSFLDLLADYVFVSQAMLVTFLPAYYAGMLSTQAEIIKQTLHDILLQPQGRGQCQEIERFIRYVEARPCKFRLYKLVPLDCDLFGIVLSFCVTYLIVIIQLTKTY